MNDFFEDKNNKKDLLESIILEFEGVQSIPQLETLCRDRVAEFNCLLKFFNVPSQEILRVLFNSVVLRIDKNINSAPLIEEAKRLADC